MPDDCCFIHGYEHMATQFGNPIPFCTACEAEREARDAAKFLPYPHCDMRRTCRDHGFCVAHCQVRQQETPNAGV